MSFREGKWSRTEIRELFGVDEDFLIELERESIICSDPEGCYGAESIERVRISRTLHDDLGLNLAGVEVVLHLLDTIHAERTQFREVLAWLKSQLPEE